MLAINQPQATANELMQLWEQDGIKATRRLTIHTDTEYVALLERVRLLEQENAVLQRQVQLLQDLAVLD
jgi:hypothetical protein